MYFVTLFGNEGYKQAGNLSALAESDERNVVISAIPKGTVSVGSYLFTRTGCKDENHASFYFTHPTIQQTNNISQHS